MINEKKISRVTVRFSSHLKLEMQKALINAGYGLHGKSKWMKMALLDFIKQPNFTEMVDTGGDTNQAELSHAEVFYIDAEADKALNEAIIQIRERFPLMEGVKSSLIRAATVYSLLFANSKNSKA